ncbi:hypothetical protein Y032_0043g734 [Ancylostoma ceylanicum]|uniref:Uncharacterized protein n=1 Tax=Ancylostoma ceylanicum TaxID=53326 RepID=A0A016UFV5_9BILA|nr:hypothetical protein Y032_0043g734 [Ancylostoma ceylanicum]
MLLLRESKNRVLHRDAWVLHDFEKIVGFSRVSHGICIGFGDAWVLNGPMGVLPRTPTQARLDETIIHAKHTSPHAKSMQNPCKTRFKPCLRTGFCMGLAWDLHECA